MNLKKLEAFIAVLEKRSFSEAAAALKSSQPSISLKIKSLEEELGTELLERGPSAIKPTTSGSLVYQAAKEIIQRWGQLEDDLQRFQDTLTGTLTIGASTIPGTYLVPGWIKNFRKLFPMVDVAIEIGDSKEILDKLLDHQVDVGIVGIHQQPGRVVSRLISTDSLVLIVPKEFPLPPPGELDFNLLKQFDLVLREEGSGTRKEMEEYLAMHGFSLADFHTSVMIGSSEAVISAVEAGLGISFVSKLAAVPALKANRIRIVDSFNPYQRNFYFSTLSETANRPIIREFADFLKGVMPD